MKASQIYNTKQASNSQQVLLYSNRSAVIIALVRESSTKAPSRERERERERTTTSRSSTHAKKTTSRRRSATDGSFAKAHSFFRAARRSSQRSFHEAPNVPSGSSQRSFLEAPNVRSRSSQRSFSKFPTFFLDIARVLLSYFHPCPTSSPN